MKKLIGSLAFAAAALAGTAAQADVIFYDGENFAGMPIDAKGTVPSLVSRGFNDRARSAVVGGTGVEICRDINFSGGCTVLRPGRYPTLGEWNDKISSVRAYVAPRTEPVAQAGTGRVTFYEAEDFEGSAFSVNGAVPNFQADFDPEWTFEN